ncbi:MAG: hypothetical protein ABSB91_09255, partial [Sedimentisphaerales bacterium]
MRRLLVAVFVILALFAVSNVYAGELSVTKCTVTAGKTEGYDTIVVSGTMNATVDDLSAASSIEVTIDSDDMVSPCVQSFPINENSFKRSKGKYNYARTENASKTSFKFDTKTGKFSFTAKNVDLAGLGCPLTIEIEIGDYICTAEVDEAIVNGSKKPIPINLMMGVKDSMRVDKIQVKRGTKPNSDQLTVKGGFAVEDTSVNMVDEEFVVTLDSQTFTLPAGSFIAKTGQFTCKKIAPTEGGIASASATFNFTKCSFTITIKNTEIEAGSGTVDFCVAFAGYSQCVQVTLPTDIPSVPTGVTASAGDGQVSISWSAVSGATSYNIYWSTTSGVTKTNGTKITDATSPYSH